MTNDDHRDGAIAELLRAAWLCAQSSIPGVRALAVGHLRRAVLLKTGTVHVQLFADPEVARIVALVGDTDRALADQVGALTPTAGPRPRVN